MSSSTPTSDKARGTASCPSGRMYSPILRAVERDGIDDRNVCLLLCPKSALTAHLGLILNRWLI